MFSTQMLFITMNNDKIILSSFTIWRFLFIHHFNNRLTTEDDLIFSHALRMQWPFNVKCEKINTFLSKVNKRQPWSRKWRSSQRRQNTIRVFSPIVSWMTPNFGGFVNRHIYKSLLMLLKDTIYGIL